MGVWQYAFFVVVGRGILDDDKLLTDKERGGEVVVRFDFFGSGGVLFRDFAQSFERANRMYGAGAVRNDEHIAFFHFFDV